MKQIKLVVYVLSGLIALSFFFTWFTASASVSITDGGSSDASQSIIGLFSGEGFLGLLLLGATLYMFHKEIKYAFLPVAFNLLNALVILYVTTGVKYSSSSWAGSVKSGLYPGIGVYLFLWISTLLLGVLLVKEFKPELFQKGGKIDKMSFLDAITNEYVLGGVILALELWCSNNISEFNSFSGFLIGALFFIAAPYFLAKLGKFALVQNLILSHIPVYVLILVFGSLGLYNYEVAVKSVGENFFSITLIALVYEFVLRKKSDLIPEKAREYVEKLDLKKLAGIWGVVILLLFAKEFLTSSNTPDVAQDTQEEVTTEEVIEEAPSTTQEEVAPEVETETAAESESNVAPAISAQQEVVQLYSIKDPDGYTNLRATPGGVIIRKVMQNETFELLEAGETYSKIKLSDGTTGFLHNSRIVPAN